MAADLVLVLDLVLVFVLVLVQGHGDRTRPCTNTPW
jgi:hypothetical protein